MADADTCAVCGKPISGTVYLATDRVTGEKKTVCPDCITARAVCCICGMPVIGNYTDLADGRAVCARDAKTAVISDDQAERVCHDTRESLDRQFSRFLSSFPDANVSFELVDRVRLQELFRSPGYDSECPNVLGFIESQTNHSKLQHHISVLSGLPLPAFKATCAHEYGHAWVSENVSELRRRRISRETAEGFCELLAYLLMDSQNEEGQKKMILVNEYTRGQVHLFLDANTRYGLSDIVDWMKWGVDSRLSNDDASRIRNVQLPRTAGESPASPAAAETAAPVQAAASDTLVLKGITWIPDRPEALINNRTFGVRDEAQIRLGSSNVTVRCLSIRQDSVRIRIVDSGEEQELKFRASSK